MVKTKGFDENEKKEKKYKFNKKNKKNKKNINSEKENRINTEDDKDSYTQSISSSDEEIKTRRNKSHTEYKSLPCENFIRDGCCAYKHKCKYIHDIRLETIVQDTPKKGINKNFINNDEDIKCSFFYDKVQITSKENEIYEPYLEYKYIDHRRLDVFKHLGQGKSISDYEHKSFDRYSIDSYENQIINFEYQKGYLLYSNLIKFLEDSKK